MLSLACIAQGYPGIAPTAVWGEKHLNIYFFFPADPLTTKQQPEKTSPSSCRAGLVKDSRLCLAAQAGPGEGTAALPVAGQHPRPEDARGSARLELPPGRTILPGVPRYAARLWSKGKASEAGRKDRCQEKLPIGVQEVLSWGRESSPAPEPFQGLLKQ